MARVNKSADARHVCRQCGGGFVVEPQHNAHGKMGEHTKTVHGWRLSAGCNTDCGYRAKPSEGRYGPSAPQPLD